MQHLARALPLHFLDQERPLDVVLVGAGGNGSAAFDNFIMLHQGLIALGGEGLHVTVYDDDEVSPSNIVRQRYWPHEVGMSKADALVSRTNMLLGTAWRSVPVRFDPLQHRPGSLLVTAVDNLATRQAIARAEAIGNPLWLDMGCSGSKGQVVLGRHKDCLPSDLLPNVVALFPDLMTRVDDNRPSCSAADSIRRQDLLVNQTVAGSAINLLWQAFRTGKIGYNGVIIDLETSHMQAMPFMPLPETVKE